MATINCIFPLKKPSERLDKYLVSQIHHYSRELIIKAINHGDILVNGLRKKPSYLLKAHDHIVGTILEEIGPRDLIPKALIPEPEILYEDPDFLIINKPAGVNTHPTLKNINEPSIASWFCYRYPQAKTVGEDKLRPGIVHRLDKETSGVLILAKNNPTFFYFKKLFLLRKINKIYLALVKGEIKKQKDIIEFSLTRSSTSGKRKITNQVLKKTKTALTLYEVLKRYKGYTLLKVEPKTGRTHQIRIHLASIGFPVAGDKIYGVSSKNQLLFKRQMLHAQKITFLTPQNQKLTVEAPLPYDFQEALKTIAKN